MILICLSKKIQCTLTLQNSGTKFALHDPNLEYTVPKNASLKQHLGIASVLSHYLISLLIVSKT